MLEGKNEIQDDDQEESSSKDIIETLQMLHEEWKTRQANEETNTDHALKIQRSIRDRERLLQQLENGPNSVDEDVELRLAELEQKITEGEEYYESLKIESPPEIDEIEAEIRELSNDIEEKHRIQLSSSLRYLLWKLSRTDPFPLIQPVQEKCSWDDVWISFARFWIWIMFLIIPALDLFLFLFLGKLTLMFSSLFLNILLAIVFAHGHSSFIMRIVLAISVLKMFLQCILVLVSFIPNKRDWKLIAIFISCKYFWIDIT